MGYEFKSITLTNGPNSFIHEKECEKLNKEFSDGWEFVDSICQDAGSGGRDKIFGSVIVILKKIK